MSNKYSAILLFIILIIVDQLSKFIIRHFGGFYICNTGIAFGFQLPWWLIYALEISFITLILLLNYKRQKSNTKQISNNKIHKDYSRKFEVCNLFDTCNLFFVVLIISSAVSNLIDRLIFGCVIDFIDLHFWPIFNLADIFICLGAIMIILKIFKK